MGTRRSRHNKGRKPLYKEHRLNLGLDEYGYPIHKVAKPFVPRDIAPDDVAPKRSDKISYNWDGLWNGTHWSREAHEFLERHWPLGAHPEWIAMKLHRWPSTIASCAQSLALRLPAEQERETFGSEVNKMRARLDHDGLFVSFEEMMDVLA